MEKIKKIIKKMIYKFPKKYILFESVPDLSDNTKAVFDEMLVRGLNKKYKFVWRLYDSAAKDYPAIHNVKYANAKNAWYYLHRAKALICCNQFFLPIDNKQFAIYLGHGNPLKSTKGYYEVPKEFSSILCSSQGMLEIRKSFYGLDPKKMVPLGYPRNDILTKKPLNLKPFFKTDFKKIIVWYPTFRQHKNGFQTGCEKALPILWNQEKAIQLNECAKENDVLIVLKPHFAQDISKIKQAELSNIVFIDDDFFAKNNLTSYQFVGSCDALLTDYSSIYYDYTLCDKPIGLIWEDYEEYKQNPGFAVDMDFMMKGGVKIYNLEELEAFVIDVANGVDSLAEQRREIRDFANYSADGKNAERVVDYIVDKAKL